jgi:hypothetical protein
MYLFAIADLAVGSEIKVSFVPPDSSERVQVTAAIRHRTVYLYGVEFLAAGQTATSAATLAADSNQAVVTV